MAWIKRNLYFVIGSVAALALMGLAGFYLYSKWALNNKILEDLNTQYEQMDHLNKEKPHPGSGSVDNIQAAKDQQKQLRDYLGQTHKYFQPVPAVPPSPKVTALEFTAALHRLLDQLQRNSANASVSLPPDYAFSFAAQKPRVSFAKGSLEPLAVQLGEVKAICDVLCDAKVNALDNLRRERVSDDDASGPQTDYLAENSVTNELAVLTPYELTFRCFSPELAAVLAGFAGSPHGLIVRSVNVEQAAGAPTGGLLADQPPTGYPPQPMQVPPQGMQPFPPGGRFARGEAPVVPVAATPAPAATAPAPKGGLPTVLDERLLKITLTLDVVKLLAPK